MEKFDRHMATIKKTEQLQQLIQKLEAENKRLKDHHELIQELTNILITNNRFIPGEVTSNQNGSLEQVIVLVKDLSNDIKNLFKNFSETL